MSIFTEGPHIEKIKFHILWRTCMIRCTYRSSSIRAAILLTPNAKLINCRCTSELRLICVLSRRTSSFCDFGRMSGTSTVLFQYLRSATTHCLELHQEIPLCGRMTMAHRDHQKKSLLGIRDGHDTIPCLLFPVDPSIEAIADIDCTAV